MAFRGKNENIMAFGDKIENIGDILGYELPLHIHSHLTNH